MALRLVLHSDMDERIKSNLASVIESINGASTDRLQLSGGIDDLNVSRNIRDVMDSINGGFKRRVSMRGTITDMAVRTNIQNIVSAHNSRVGKGEKK